MKTSRHPTVSHPALLHRLNRIEGQVQGLRASILSGKNDCAKDMLQIKAVHAATKAFAKAYMDEYAKHCRREERVSPRISRNIDTIISSAFML